MDLGILLDPYSPKPRFRVEAGLGRASGRPVDVILLDNALPLLRFEIACEGSLLFQRESFVDNEQICEGFRDSIEALRHLMAQVSAKAAL